MCAFNPCHGNDPLKKYIKTYPSDSKSSLRLCSTPTWVLMEAYLAVPVKFLFSRYGMCMCVFGSRYFFANPKSIMFTWFARLPNPIKKLSGLISRWMNDFECTYSILETSWSANIKTVFSDNFRLQKLNKSSNDGPKRSMTMMLYSPSTPYHRTFGMPVPPCKILYSFDS